MGLNETADSKFNSTDISRIEELIINEFSGSRIPTILKHIECVKVGYRPHSNSARWEDDGNIEWGSIASLIGNPIEACHCLLVYVGVVQYEIVRTSRGWRKRNRCQWVPSR